MTLRDAIAKKMKLLKMLPVALRENDTVRQFIETLVGLLQEKDVDGRWRGKLPKVIDEGLALYSGRHFSLRKLCGDAETAAKYANLFKIPTVAICRFRTKRNPTPRIVLAISPSFVRSIPIQSSMDAIVLTYTINLAIKEVGGNKILKELQNSSAPPDVVEIFREIWGGGMPTLHSLLSRLTDVSFTRQYKVSPTARQTVWGLVSLLRYSPSLFEKVNDIKVAISVSADFLTQMQSAAEDSESRRRVEELRRLREKFITGLGRELSNLPPDYMADFALSVLLDAWDTWNAILFHEVGHLVGDHILPTVAIEESRWINKYVAQRLVELAQQHGGKRIEFPDGVVIEVTPDSEVSRIRRVLDNLVGQIFSETRRKQALAKLYNRALNYYHDLIVNNSVFEYLLRRSPTGALYLVYRAIVPYAFGLPIFSETVTNPQLTEADVYSSYRRKVGEDLADALWEWKQEDDQYIDNGGIGNGIKGKSRVKKRMQGKNISIWDWDEDDTGDVEDKGTIDEEDIDKVEDEDEEEEGGGEDEEKEKEGKGKGEQPQEKEGEDEKDKGAAIAPLWD